MDDALTPAQHAALAAIAARASGDALAQGHRIALHFHPDRFTANGMTVLAALAADGRYRSQFETGGGNGARGTTPDDPRWQWESRLFGSAYDHAPAEQRPLYGALAATGDGYGPSPRFGSCHLLLKPEVLARSSFCHPDSSAGPCWFGTASAFPAQLRMLPAAADPLDDYVEAHVHGALWLRDAVEALMLDPCYRGSGIERIAAASGMRLRWHPGYRLALTHVAACVAYRPGLRADLLQAWSGDGVTLDARDLGIAGIAGADAQQLKWAWHCVARFGAA